MSVVRIGLSCGSVCRADRSVVRIGLSCGSVFRADRSVVMIGSVARGRLVSVSITVTALGLVFVGCSAVPYAPGPSFEPSSSPPAAQVSAEPGPQPTSKPDVDLRGTLVTQDGLVTPVHSELWLEQSTTASGSSAGATGPDPSPRLVPGCGRDHQSE
jgi:hypothetical protein